jgi:hypothetical protein
VAYVQEKRFGATRRDEDAEVGEALTVVADLFVSGLQLVDGEVGEMQARQRWLLEIFLEIKSLKGPNKGGSRCSA